MNRPSHPTLVSLAAATPLPLWNQLPQDRRQELTTILATIILKQLPPRPSAPSEACDERR
jgi:hypothetical protein